jgi:hypothetical protein
MTRALTLNILLANEVLAWTAFAVGLVLIARGVMLRYWPLPESEMEKAGDETPFYEYSYGSCAEATFSLVAN